MLPLLHLQILGLPFPHFKGVVEEELRRGHVDVAEAMAKPSWGIASEAVESVDKVSVR